MTIFAELHRRFSSQTRLFSKLQPLKSQHFSLSAFYFQNIFLPLQPSHIFTFRMPTANRNLYALIVGIDNYPPPVPKLQGCVNDADSIRVYLQNRAPKDGITLQVKTLYNEQATRGAIVRQFEDHLAKAGPNDVALFYYCGHGTQEPANEYFWDSEPDKMCETLVCYDSRLDDGMDLADKEMASLIDVVAKKGAHTVMIFDCCHSGTMTRDLDENLEEIPNTTTSRTIAPRNIEQKDKNGYRFVRPLSAYLRPEDFERSLDENIGTRDIQVDETRIKIPNPKHIYISACRSDQTAKETTLGKQRRGVFSYSLVKTLEEMQGSITYADLVRRVRAFVGNKVSDQMPQIGAEPQDLVNLPFLNGMANIPKRDFYNMYYDTNQRAWVINAGSVHGIKANALLLVFNNNEPDTRLINKAIGKVTVIGTEANLSSLKPSFPADTTLTYKAVLFSLPIPKTKIFLSGDVTGITLARQALASVGLDGTPSLYIEEVKDVKASEYILHSINNQYIVTRYTDGADKPLIEQLVGFTPSNALKAIDNLEHIGKWEATIDLTNPSSSLPSDAIKIEIYQYFGEENEKLAGDNGDEVLFTFKKGEDKATRPRFRAKMLNNTDQRLYCAPLYLSASFEIGTQLLHEGGTWLEVGEEIWLAMGKPIRVGISDEYLALGKNTIKETFKVVFSTEEFDALLMRQNKLNAPKVATRSADSLNPLARILGAVQSRSLEFGADEDTSSERGNLTDWNTTIVTMTIKCVDSTPTTPPKKPSSLR
ncbi:MAG: caspase domain-containing protein [Bacteroidia bacterium]